MSPLALGLIAYGCGFAAAVVVVVALCKAAHRGEQAARTALERRDLQAAIDEVGDVADATVFDFPRGRA